MTIYLFCFFASFFLLLLSEGIKKRIVFSLKDTNKIISNLNPFFLITVFIALLIPSMLAGYRDYTIGTDVLVYGNYWFEMTKGLDLQSYVQWATASSIGSLYALLNYTVSRFSENPHVFYFVLSFI